MPRTKGNKNVKTVTKTDAVATDTCKVTVSEKVSVTKKSSELGAYNGKKPTQAEIDTLNKNIKNPKLDILKNLMKETNRKHGSQALKFASEEKEPDRIPFGVKEVDELTHGGIPHKRFSIIWGAKSAGKTTLVYSAIASAQKQNKVVALIDMERTFSPQWASQNGVDLDKLVLGSEYPTAEAAMDDFITIVKNKAADLVIIDSIQALSPKGEQETKKGVEKSLEDDTMALLARKLSQFFRIASSSVYAGNVAILLIGQARTDLGGFIAFDKLSGGHALGHWSSLTLQISRMGKSEAPTKKVKEDGKTKELIIGFTANIKIEKRKIESEVDGASIQVPFYFDSGFKK